MLGDEAGLTNGNQGEGLQGPPLKYSNEQLNSTTLHKLNTMRKEGKLCDVTMQVGHNTITAHRAVLATTSQLLMEMFTESESERDSRHHFKLPASLDYKAFKILVNFAYTSELDIPCEMVTSVYKAANLLKIQPASDACSHYLAENLTPTNCLAIRSFANGHRDRQLTALTDEFIQQNIKDVIASRGFTELPSMKFDIFGVTGTELAESSERTLAQMVISWIEEALYEEQKFENLCEHPHVLYFTSDNDLRDCLNLENEGNAPMDDLSNDVNRSQLVQDYKKMKKRKQIPAVKGAKVTTRPEATLTSLSKSKSGSLEKLKMEIKEWGLIATSMTGKMHCLSLGMVDNKLTAMQIRFRPYPSQDQTQPKQEVVPPSPTTAGLPKIGSLEKEVSLVPLCPMPSARASMGTAVMNGKLYVLGGYDRGECLKTVDTYDLQSNVWSSVAPMTVPRGRFDVAQLQGKLYACGGSNGTSSLRTAECYDMETNTWTKLPDMKYERSTVGVTAVLGTVMVVGGWANSQGLKTCEQYDPQTDVWSPIANMNSRRSQTGVCTIQDKVLAIGGCDSWNCLNTVEMYDPIKDEWSLLPSMSKCRRGAGVAVFKGHVYVVGGSDGQYSLQCVEIFDFATQQWSHGPNLSIARANVGVAVLSNRLFAIGGFSRKDFLNSVEYLSSDRKEWCSFLPSKSQSSSSESSDSDCCLPGNNNKVKSRSKKTNGQSDVNGDLNGYHDNGNVENNEGQVIPENSVS